MKTIAKKTFSIYRKLATGKWYRRIFLTALSAFVLVWGVGTAASIIRDFVAYHTWACLTAMFVGVNVMLSWQKLFCIWKNLSVLADDARLAATSQSASDVAAEFAAAVNAGGTEEVFED